MKHMKILTIAALGFAILAVMVFAGGIAVAAPGPGDGGNNPADTRRATLTLGGNSGPSAEVELRLESGVLEARVKGESFPLNPDNAGTMNHRYTLCLNDLFIDDDRVEDDGRVEMDDNITVNITALSGLLVRIIDGGDIHDHSIRAQLCTGEILRGPVVLSGTVG